MLQDLSASVFFPPCSQHRTLGGYGILKKDCFGFVFFFSRNLYIFCMLFLSLYLYLGDCVLGD